MQEARNRRETEKQRRLQEDMIEEQKIRDQLRQIGEEFNRKDGKEGKKEIDVQSV